MKIIATCPDCDNQDFERVALDEEFSNQRYFCKECKGVLEFMELHFYGDDGLGGEYP